MGENGWKSKIYQQKLVFDIKRIQLFKIYYRQ